MKAEIEEYEKLGKQITKLQARRDLIKEMLVNEYGEGDHVIDGKLLRIEKVNQRRLNNELLKQVIPKDKLDKYLKSISFFKVQVKETEKHED